MVRKVTNLPYSNFSKERQALNNGLLQYQPLKKWQKILGFCVTTAVILGIIGALVYALVDRSDSSKTQNAKGAVVTNGKGCAAIGASILEKGGTAVDAAIAALFCEGVSMPQSMGLGGGFLMTIYSKEKGIAKTLDTREVAPKDATEDMFHGDSKLSTKGGTAVAVPGELLGYWEAYKEFGGKVAWKELVQPTIDMCKNGIEVTQYLTGVFAQKFDLLYSDPYLRESFINPATNQTYKQGEKMKRLRLAATLEQIAEKGGDILNNAGSKLTQDLAKDIQEKGGIITVEDLANYKPKWEDPIKVNLPFGQQLYTVPLPGSGVILSFIMNLLTGFLDYTQPESVTNWQRIIESFKFGYGKRTELGDPDYVDIKTLLADLTSADYAHDIRKNIYDNQTFQDPEHYGANTTQVPDHGTAHISVLSTAGDAVSVTSTINLYFGAGFMSPSTGIILNDEMDDFSSPNVTNDFGIPPSIANYIKPGKRPLSSMCPSIILDQNQNVRLVIGAAGGTKITTSVALILIRHLWFNVPLQKAVSDRRLHHQLFPMLVEYEETYADNMEFVKALEKIGHKYQLTEATGFSAVTAISRIDKKIQAATDTRRPGDSSLVYD